MDIITRKEAKRDNLRKYYTGKPCKRGHLSERYADSGTCIECRSLKEQGYSKTYYSKHRDDVITRSKTYAEENKEKRSEYLKTYAEENKEKLKTYGKEYYSNNKDKYLSYSRKRIERLKDTVEYRLHKVMRMMVSRVMKKKAWVRTIELIGYSSDELRDHIESQFLEGMSWDNYGDWHIDHIKPIKLFTSEGITDPKVINALSNLQPLWAADNLQKGAKY